MSIFAEYGTGHRVASRRFVNLALPLVVLALATGATAQTPAPAIWPFDAHVDVPDNFDSAAAPASREGNGQIDLPKIARGGLKPEGRCAGHLRAPGRGNAPIILPRRAPPPRRNMRPIAGARGLIIPTGSQLRSRPPMRVASSPAASSR